MPTNFIYDGTGFSNQPKTDLVPIGADDPLKHVQAVDWNTVVQAALDIQTFCRGGAKLYKTGDATKHCDAILYNGDPTGVVTAEKGSYCLDITNVKIWQNTDGATGWQPANANAFNYGWFGNGIDGSPTFDGAATILGMAPVANVYTLTRDIFLDTPVGVSGVTIKTAGFAIYVKTDLVGPASGMFTIQDDGPNGSGSAAGTGRQNGAPDGGPGRLKGGKSGGAGGVNNAFGQAGVASPNTCKAYPGGNGGVGGTPNAGGSGGGGGPPPNSVLAPAIQGQLGDITNALRGYGSDITGGAWFTPGSGGSGGGSNGLGTGSGGGGGAGGGYTVLATKHVTNPGNVTLSANGGNGVAAFGQAGGNSAGGGAGGGGGYAILILGYGTAPVHQANGGIGGAGAGSGTSGANGTAGQAVLFRMS